MARLSLIAAGLALVAMACKSGPTIDGTDVETFDASITEVKAALAEDDQARLDDVLDAFEYLYSDNVISSLNASDAIQNRIRGRLDGMDATDIFAEWNERVNKAIEALEEKQENTDSAMESLKDVRVRGVEYYVQRGQSVVKLSIHNRTDHRISKVYFRGSLMRNEPRKWILDDDFNYNIRLTEGKDLGPDERAVWNFALLSPVWKKAPADVENLYFYVIVTRIDGAPEQPIYDAYTDRFTPKDRRRLRRLISLKESIGTFEPDLVPEIENESEETSSL
ncbi:MAG: hypothetical protein OXH56_02620 [Gemmatimonadetes bacterium]|nr:hypothetical protein [Gemmatimonadota bacterium]